MVVNACGTVNTWTGNSTNWFAITNWSQGTVPNACGVAVLIPSGLTNYPVLTSNVAVGDLTIQNTASINLQGNTLSVCGNWTGGASANAVVTGTGSVVLNGTAQQSLSGQTQFDELRLNNSAGAKTVLSSIVQITRALDLQTGNFNASTGSVTFLSPDQNTCAIIDNFSNGNNGTISGSIHAQRGYAISLQSYNQHFMGSPVSNPAFSQFGASGTSGYLVGTPGCDESKVAPYSPYSTVLGLDESHGANCTTNEWIAELYGTAQNGVGYAVARIGAGVLTLTGAANMNSSYTLTGLTNSNWQNITLQGHTVTSGWHLVSNPYLATMNLTTVNTGIDNQVLIWNTAGQYAGTYQAYVVGVDATVPPFQGFMVHVTNSTVGLPINQLPSYTFNATDRGRNPLTFFRANDNELTLEVENSSTHLLDKTVVAFNTDATDQFDPQYDANKPSGALNRHTLYSVCNGQWMARNILHDLIQTGTVPVGFEPGKTGSYTINFTGVNTFDPTTYIYLEDKALGIMHNVRAGAYTFNADSVDNWDRFVLHFTPPAAINITDATCNSNGAININQPGTANWNYTVTNNINTIITSGVLNQNASVNLTSVPAGSYTLTLKDNNNYTVTEALQVNGPDPVTAAFSAPTSVATGQNIVLTSTTTNASAYQWDLGNGQTASGSTITCSYTTAGNYTVVLTVDNLSGCTSTASQTITVNATATGLNNLEGNKGIEIWGSENKIYVDFRVLQKVDAVISVYNLLGQEISSEKCISNMLYQKEIKNIEAAYMVVSVKLDDQLISKKVFINNIH
jgi:hypothetical protein